MKTVIKCERMKTWDFDHCHDCKRFRVRRGKGLNNWGCVLNNDTAKEKREFGMIWAIAMLQDRRQLNISIPEVEIIYVSKWKKKGR